MTRRPPPPSDKALQGLANHRAGVADDKRRDIERAIRHLRKANVPINIARVANQAGVRRKTVYKHKDLVTVIDQHRHQPPTADPEPTSRESSIVAGLRIQLAAKDSEIKKLRTTIQEQEQTIALLYGQLDSHTF